MHNAHYLSTSAGNYTIRHQRQLSTGANLPFSRKCAVFDRVRLWWGGDARLKRQGTIVLVLAVEILESLKRRSADSGGSKLSREMPEGARLQICSLA